MKHPDFVDARYDSCFAEETQCPGCIEAERQNENQGRGPIKSVESEHPWMYFLYAAIALGSLAVSALVAK